MPFMEDFGLVKFGLKCCDRCFCHEWLRGYVIENSHTKGQCDYCGRNYVQTIPIHEVNYLFENLMELYTPSNEEYGEFLIDLIQWDYEVFDDDLYSSGEAARLLKDILFTGWDDDSGEPPVNPLELYYRRSSLWYHTSMAGEWDEFCHKVKENPATNPSLPPLLLDEFVRIETTLPKESTIYRARIGFVENELTGPRPYEKQEIGAPPPLKARAARANFDGEIVLYAADQEATSIAETRPWRGILVSVAEISVCETVRLVDLSKPIWASNPFIDETPQYGSELEELLIAFGAELGRPLRKADDAMDYLPCQKLVAWIRKSGHFHGIRYPSAMVSKGTNIVIFDPNLVQVGPSKLVQISDIKVSYDPFEDE